MEEEKKEIKTPIVLDKLIPEIVYEKVMTNMTDKKSTYIKVSGETTEKAFENFKKVKDELKLK